MAKTQNELGQPSYWDKHYSHSDGVSPVHEWLKSYSDLEAFFDRNLFTAPGVATSDNPMILHLGSGDSHIPLEFASRGYTRQLCADFSPAVVKMMSDRHASVPGIEWRLMDVRDMKSISDASVDVAFDKSTLDVMIHGSPWSPPQDVKGNTVLKDNGRFLCLTFRQPHFMKPLLNPEGLWDLDMQVLGDSGAFNYYGYLLRKASKAG
ncbi:hypothetical protein VTJ49DRAFT_3145 [Mycothermus thermophilus]|uniref:Methyltransferase type 11 domain-containing protein n=1 Tax=Humicola insolens TaxID=85995 RepID=A0ABR3V8F9_HUMIN